MKILQDNILNFNSSMQFDFNGGNISSDSGLLAVRAFAEALGMHELLESVFPEDRRKKHSTASVIEQLMYTSIAGYQHDDDSDKLRKDPIFTSILGKEALASQPTVSRCINGLTMENLDQVNGLLLKVFEKAYKTEKVEQIVLDIDSTHVQTFGTQENSAYNYHYSSTGFHPLVVYNGLNGDLLKVELRKGSIYTSKHAREFLEPLMIWIKENFQDVSILIRGDSGFATPEMYQLAEEYDADYLIRLKANATLTKLSEDLRDDFHHLYVNHFQEYCVLYDSFYYQASSWDTPRRVVVKVERKAGELHPRTGYIVTSLGAEPKVVLRAYNLRGNMENFIKETKLDFGMDSLSHSSFQANCAKCLIKALAYNLINIMKRLVLPKEFLKSRMLSLRAWLIKIGAKHVKSGRKVTFKFCSSYPYSDVFLSIMERINNLCFA